MDVCYLCPRMCGARRNEGEMGYCSSSDTMRIARIALHPFEEPPISGERGSGTVFFCGCSLGCVFCQNGKISRCEVEGRPYEPEALAEELLGLEHMGATNINFVTGTHFTPKIAEALKLVKNRLNIPVVWNSSGYERVETLRLLEGLVDVYLPDMKYMSADLADKYSSAPDYAEYALPAIAEMYRQVGRYSYSEEGTIKRGVVIRHLVLPSQRKDSIEVLRRIADTVPSQDVLLSLMSQYTPDFAMDTPYKELHRRVTRFEYESVLSVACELGFDGFSQDMRSAVKDYTPSF